MQKVLTIGFVLGLLGVGLAVRAQDIGNVPGASPSPPEYVLHLTGPQVQLLFEAIQEKPFKLAAPIVQAIQKQVGEQTQGSASVPSGGK